MNEFFTGSAFFGVILSLAAYEIGLFLKKKLKHPLANPLLIAVALTIAVLVVSGIDYDVYYEGAKIIGWFLTPATVCLAIPLYEQVSLIKKYPRAILAGILTGVVTSVGSVLGLSVLFGLSHAEYVTFLPKSVTTAIGMGIAEQLGGYSAVTAAVIILSGILGNMLAEPFLKLLKVTEPVAKGLAIGTASHAIGTAKALEMGEVEGAVSALSIAVAGVLTVAASAVFALFY